jgi:hypothetical protein
LSIIANNYFQNYIERAAGFDGISLETPVFIVPEGHEPVFFTAFFSWDPSKVNVSVHPSAWFLFKLQATLYWYFGHVTRVAIG